MKLTLDTIMIFVQDVDKLKAFYVNLLKLDVIEETKAKWLLLKAGACCLGLHRIGEPYREADQGEYKFDNNTKIVFAVDTDIFAIREDLIRNNVIMKEVMTWDNYDFWICDGEDPEGNVFQLKQRKIR